MTTRTEHILDALDIEVVKKKGFRAWALCPYHEDHDPSWFIRVFGKRTGQHYCFACKKGGTLLELVMHVRALSAKDARQFIETSGKGFEPAKIKARVIERPAMLGRVRFRMPREVIVKPFEKWSASPKRYAIKRGITAEQVERFQIGYAVDGRLRGRLVFPFIDRHGPASYSARTFVGEEPRFLTPHESEHADLGAIFGEHLWPRAHERDVIVVTEGAIDALAVDRACDFNIGALNGSDIDSMQAVKLVTFKLVLCLTDNDPAGNNAAKVLRGLLGRHTAFERVSLPEGVDAAKMDRDGLSDALSIARRRTVA